MKKNNVLYTILLFFLFWGGETDRVYAVDDRFFASREELDSIVASHPEKIIFQDQDPKVNGIAGVDNGNLSIHYMNNRRALTGRHCTVNKLINVVGVGSWNENMSNLTNDDLGDYATFPSIVGAGVTVDPIVSIRDMKNYYSKGTQAGYCIVASSGDAVLSLDIIKALSIGFYREGELVGTKVVEEGQDGAGVNLSLIQVPGSDEACITLTATSDWVFDEISLDRSGGVQVSVGDILKIKYAFVGKAREFTITENTTNGIPAYQTYTGNTGLALQKMEGWNPVLLGIPFPFVNAEVEKMTNADYDDYASLTPILVIGYQGGAKFRMKDGTKNEIYKAGTEVGFKYLFGSGLALDAGAWISLLLFDRNGDVIQEETISAGVLNLSVAKGGSGIASVTATKDFSGAELRFHTVIGVNLGMMGIHYGFIREKPDIDHHCPINPSVDMNLCETQSSIQLQSNPDISVTWTLRESRPDNLPADVKVTPGGYVTGLQKGTYVFRATAADGCYEELMITSGINGSEKQCGIPFIDDMDPTTGNVGYELSDEIYDTSGSLISVSDLTDPGNIIDADLGNYATYTSGLNIASDLRIIGIRTKDGSPIHSGFEEIDGVRVEKPIRIGFIVEFQATGVDLSLLQFFQIRCYNDKVPVYSHVIEESNAISAGIAGSDQALKVRYSIEVPAVNSDGYPIEFDEFMLWTSGVLNLGASKINIYYAFSEEADSDCNDPLGCGSIVLSHEVTGTTINADETKYGSAVAVANVTDNLGYLVDNDLNMAMTLTNTVTVGGGTTIAVDMGRTLDYHHQLGIVVDNKTYTAAINVGNWMTVETFYKGVSTGDKFTDWKVLGADVIGFGDKNYLFMQPKKRYDEVRMTIANIVGALDIQRFFGLFLRKDVDNDGIPDCQDPESCDTSIGDIEINDVCVGETIIVSGKGTISTDYYIYFSEPGISFIKVISDEQGYFTASYVTKTPGHHQMVFYDGSGKPLTAVDYSVHPTRTTWKTTASNTDWNKWDNWTDGSPYCCTDVIIPSNAKLYPVLDEAVADVPDKYCCRYIHFEPRAAVEKTTRLNYRKAWAEMELVPNRYYMLSAPLTNMYTGDMFIPALMNGVHTGDYFTELTADNTPQNRFNPRVYQRLWATTAKGRLMDGSETTLAITTTKWSKNFNHLAHLYQPGNGFSLWVDNGRLSAKQGFRFRFPKEHTEYNYFSDFDQSQLNITETLAKDITGRFIYEREDVNNPTSLYKDETRTVYTNALPLSVTLTAEESTSHFLVGNPFMSHIDVKAFMAGNKNVQSIKIYDGNTANTVVAVDAQLLGTADITSIAPMQSFFVELGAEATTTNILFTEDMLLASPQSVLKHQSESAGRIPFLKIEAENTSVKASTLLVGNSSVFGVEPGVESLFDNEIKPSLAIFTVQDEQAYDILGVNGATEIPLGMCLQKNDTLTLCFRDNGLGYAADYVLLDKKTGIHYSLQEEVVLQGVSTNVGRFALKQKQATAIKPVDKKDVYITVADEHAIVKSSSPDIVYVDVYTLNGSKVHSQKFPAIAEATISLRTGINILKVTLKGGAVRNFKVIV